MKRVSFFVLLASMFAFVSCGEKFDELKKAAEIVEKAPDMVEKMEKSANESEKRIQERRAKGDTLSIKFTELMKFLPESIDGYTPGKPEGQTTNTYGFSFSTAKHTFTKENSDGSTDRVTIELFDYNQGHDFFVGLTMWTSMGMSFEDTNGWQKTFDTGIADVFAMEDYKYDGKRTALTYAIGYRFYLAINVENVEGTDFAKNLAKKVDMKTLAKM
ncbi:MAG: hypothetical protein M9949_01555 [Candidatus Kapabacteria bacterium]|nr:hypothetical protein [Candidatus Kapabacteria bacterium]